jgi:F420-0:gamma-glutamyl ligase-like protein
METITNILASFDIFQVLLSAIPMITDPIVNALDQTFTILFDYFRKLFLAHPGLLMGVIVFTTGYLVVKLTEKIRQYLIPAVRPLRKGQ